MTFWAFQVLNGVSFGMLLFLLGAGLSLIYGVLRILNLAHGSYYVLGAYVALSTVQATGSFLLAAVAGTAAVTAGSSWSACCSAACRGRNCPRRS